MSGEGIISEDVHTLLISIHEKGSLKAAADASGMSYRKAWGDIKQAETLLGYELTEKSRGGKEGGQSLLTPNAIKLIEAYKALQQRLDDAVEKAYEELKRNMERD